MRENEKVEYNYNIYYKTLNIFIIIWVAWTTVAALASAYTVTHRVP